MSWLASWAAVSLSRRTLLREFNFVVFNLLDASRGTKLNHCRPFGPHSSFSHLEEMKRPNFVVALHVNFWNSGSNLKPRVLLLMICIPNVSAFWWQGLMDAYQNRLQTRPSRAPLTLRAHNWRAVCFCVHSYSNWRCRFDRTCAV
jgi:hypothetical protein